MIVLRELTGGLYFAKPKRRWTTKTGRRGVDTLRYTEPRDRANSEGRFRAGQVSAAGILPAWTKPTYSRLPGCGVRWSDEVHDDYPDSRTGAHPGGCSGYGAHSATPLTTT